MKPFIRNDQYNIMKSQTQGLVNAHSTFKDLGVITAKNVMNI